jgi:hypothetical protein
MVAGPFLADSKNNDAAIVKHLFHTNHEGILGWLHENDILLLDRGFRDSLKTIELFGFDAIMPRFLNGKKQFTTTDANYTRCATKVRWVVESGKFSSSNILTLSV